MPARAQITDVTNSTSTPIPGAGHDYIKMLSESVNPANGSISLRLQVPTPTGRKLALPFSFAYDSSGVQFPGASNDLNTESTFNAWMTDGYRDPLRFGGWGYTVPYVTSGDGKVAGLPPNNKAECSYAAGYIFHDSNGGRHTLGLANQTIPTAAACHDLRQWLSASGDLYQATIPSSGGLSIADADGTVYGGKSGLQIEDRNGNQVSITFPTTNANDKSSFTVKDTLGRTLISSSGFDTPIDTITVSGLANPYTVTWGTASFNFTPNATEIGGTKCSWAGDDNSVPAITSITLPNGQEYQFTYDPTFGLLDKITYPGGGYVSYVWGYDAQSAVTYWSATNGCSAIYDAPAVLKRYVSFDGQTIALEQDFAYSTTWNPNQDNEWTSKQTTVTTHDDVRGTNFQTVYTYSFATTNTGEPYQPLDFTPPDPQIPLEQTIVYQSTSGSVLRTVTKGWYDANELACELQTLDNGLISGTFYTYGPGAAITDKKEYDYGLITSTSVCQNQSTAPSGITPSRETAITYQSFAATPIYPSAPSIFDRPSSVITYGNGTRVAEIDYTYDQNTPASASATSHDETNYGPSSSAPRGNATTITKQCFPNCTNAGSTYGFDETGQVLSFKDSCGNATCGDVTGTSHTTSYAYSDSYSSCGGSAPPAGSTNAFLTKLTDALGHTDSFCYGYADGFVRSSTDKNGRVTDYKYNDSLDRLTETDYPDGGQTLLAYNDSPYSPSTPSPSVTATKKITSGINLVTLSAEDGMEQVVKTELLSDPQGTIYTATVYDGLGRNYTTTNPYRSTSDPTYGLTTYIYDALGRSCLVAPPGSTASNSTCPTSQPSDTAFTTYLGNTTTVFDEQGHSRKNQTDSFGRLVNIWEDPNGLDYKTVYTYDALDDLLTVAQGGTHNRTFAYDSLKRLTSSHNPETGTVTYTYDPNSNVATKLDARAFTITYAYDVLNRMTGKTYSNGDHAITYAYDQTGCLGVTCYNVGRRTGMTDAGGSESWAYDSMGRELAEQRTTNSITKSTAYTYDLNGDLMTLTYPSGRKITYGWDSAARPISAIDTVNGINYAQGGAYTPQGALSAVTLGAAGSFAGISISDTYNNRLQPNELKSSTISGNATDITYNFVDSSGHNNGNVFAITNNLDNTRSQIFTYDSLNRLATAETTEGFSTNESRCWGESYTYDQWSNLTSIGVASAAYSGCSQESLSVTALANNQLSATGVSYDASGNVNSDGTYTYLYNSESELTQSSIDGTYTYDGDGNRLVGSNGTYWYGAGTEVLDESNSSGTITAEFAYFGGKRIAWGNGGNTNINYYAPDMLGSNRTVFFSDGQICFQGDLYPFGGLRVVNDNLCMGGAGNFLFMGKERDDDNLDNFGARQYTSQFGRWMSPDWSAIPAPVPYANLSNPQTLNLYAMVHDNPESFADLDGHSASCDPHHDYCNSHEPSESLANAAAECFTNPGLCGSEKLIVEQKDQIPQEPPAQPDPQPAPTNPDGTPKPPPVPVPGNPDLPWKWNPDPGNPRGGTWGPDGWKGPNPPNGSWDPNGHWDINDGHGSPVQHYDPKGKPLTPDQAHPGPIQQSSSMWDRVKSIAPAPVARAGTAAIILYLIVSEGSRLYPPRNAIPVP